MIKYTDIKFETINKLSREEANKYIAAYGDILAKRVQRISKSMTSSERRRALKFSTEALEDIVSNLDISHKIQGTPVIKEFGSKTEATARLTNLVIALRSERSTITGQKKLTIIRHKRVKETLTEYGIKKKFTHKQLDFLDDVFEELGHSRDEYTSGEIIESFSEVYEQGMTKADLIQAVVDKLEFVDPDIIEKSGFIFA